MLSIKHLSKAYVAGRPVLSDIDLDIAARGITAIIGPSGTGKSTLIRCINRLVEPTSGSIEFEGHDLTRLTRHALRQARRRIGMVFQEFNLVERLTVMENLLSGRLGYVSAWKAWRRRFPPGDVARAFELLDTVGLSSFANQRADSLSGGQRQRVGIARAVMQEPAAAARGRADVLAGPQDVGGDHAAAHRHCARATIPVMVNMHDVELARRFADRIVGMAGGRIVFDGPPARLSDETSEDDLWRRRLAALTLAREAEFDSMTDRSAGAAGSRATLFPPDWRARAAWIALAAYVVYAAAQMDVSAERVAVGIS
mgnify:CR=1 FL=1